MKNSIQSDAERDENKPEDDKYGIRLNGADDDEHKARDRVDGDPRL
jgi:hypothetical protein